MAKKDFSAALHKTAQTQDQVVADRFARAESTLLSGKPVVAPGTPLMPVADQPSDASVTEPRQLVTRYTFSMPSGEHALIEQLRSRAAREGRNTSRSEVIRAGLQSLMEMEPESLVAILDGLEKVKPGRK